MFVSVESLIYWRDPKKSGIVFGGTLIILLSLSYFSLISVFAYLSLITLVGTISFRIYKNVLQAVQKTSDGHPFKEFLEADITLPQDKVRELSEIFVSHANAATSELRRLFLVEDLVDSIKFGVTLWVLTYVGAWFNGMTLLIIGKSQWSRKLCRCSVKRHRDFILMWFVLCSVCCSIYVAKGL